MTFPGDHQIRQFARGSEVDCLAFIGDEGEIIIDLDNDRLFLYDGTTPGGVKFYNANDVDALLASAGLSLPIGTLEMALAATDINPASWPATALAGFAHSEDANLTGGPTADTPPANSNNRRIATTEWVTANFMVAGYTGSNVNQTTYPLWTQIVAQRNGASANRNAIPSSTPRLDNANFGRFKIGGVGSVLAGTWRCRGVIATDLMGENDSVEIQRVG